MHDFDGRRGSAVNSLVSGDCIISGGSLTKTLLSTGSRVHSYSELNEAVVLPYCEIGRGARLKRVVVDRGVNIPEGLVVGEDPEFDAQVVPAHRRGDHADHPADGRQVPGEQMIEVLSVASEVFPLVKTGGLADVVGRAARRRWRRSA